MSISSTPSQPEVFPARFVVMRKLGESVAATTYLARDATLDRLVVVKSVHGRHAGDPVARTRFEREARAAASINHPNVVGIYDYGTHLGADYLVMRYVEGETLRQHMTRHRRFTAESAVRIAGQLLGGLGAIHAAGLIHRDVKPENVIAGNDGLLRITDFGIAVAAADPRLTTHGQVWGTAAYMAPEQALGRPVSAATDVYAVGVILFELLTGRLPFNGKESAAVALAHVSFPPPPLHEINPQSDASPALEAVLRRALEKDPAKRPQSAAELAEALAAVSAAPGATLAVSDPSNPTVPIRRAKVETTLGGKRPAAARDAVRRRPRWAAVTLALLLLGAGISWLGSNGALGFWSDHRNEPSGSAAGIQATATQAVAKQAPPSETIPIAAAPTQPVKVATVTTTPTRAPTPPPTVVMPTIEPPTTAPVIVEPSQTATPAPTATQRPRRPRATATAIPPATSTTEAVFDSSGPTIAAVNPSASLAQTFAVSDWQGGFSGDQTWYGRAWIALYGAQSQYPQATIAFTLETAPTGEGAVTLDGLDDEWPGNVSVAISVNGVIIFSGASPWDSWNGEGHGENANWSTVTLTIPAGTLRAGLNTLVVANTEPADNFGIGPYVLLSGASIASP